MPCRSTHRLRATAPSLRVTLRILRLTVSAALCCGLIQAPAAAQKQRFEKPVAQGIAYTQEITEGAEPLIVNILRVDLKAPGVKVRYGQAQDVIGRNGPTKGREPLHTLAQRHGATAAINGDFAAWTADPLGLGIRDGELISETMDYRVCLGLGESGVLMDVLTTVGSLNIAGKRDFLLHGINRVPHGGEVVALTPLYTAAPAIEKPGVLILLKEVNLPVRVSQEMQGTVERVLLIEPGESLPVCPPDHVQIVAVGGLRNPLAELCNLRDTVRFRFDLTPNGPAPARGRFPSRGGSMRGRAFTPCWTDVQQAIGGGPWLVRNGEVAVDGEAQGFDANSFVNKRHPRTAAGVTAQGKLLLVTVDGRYPWSRGASLPEMAAILKQAGAVNAINLDGGGSTSMFVDGGVVNAPSDGRLRWIPNGLLLFGDPIPAEETQGLQILPNAPNGFSLRVGEAVQFQVADASGQPLDPKRTVLWGTSDGLGFISQQGLFKSYRPGSVTIYARVGSQRLSLQVGVGGADPGLPPDAPEGAKTEAAPDMPKP